VSDATAPVARNGVVPRVLPRDLLNLLRCPYCSGRLDVSLEVTRTTEGIVDGILRCDCYEYPVVRGIAVLRQIGGVASTRNAVVDRLRRHDADGALALMLDVGTGMGVPAVTSNRRAESGNRWLKRILRRRTDGSAAPDTVRVDLSQGFRGALYSSRPATYADYLFHRYANPSLLAAIPLLALIASRVGQRGGYVLDMLCGVGHTSSLLTQLAPDVGVIAGDYDFVNLFLATQLVAPRVIAVCLDADLPLPFVDVALNGFFCLDGLHYVRSKSAFLAELARVLEPAAVWAFAHVHVAGTTNPNPGAPLTARGYADRLHFAPCVLLRESDVLSQFRASGGLDLTRPSAPTDVADAHALSIVGSGDTDLFRPQSHLDEIVLDHAEHLGFNPIYRRAVVPGGLRLEAIWPSEDFHRECAADQTEPARTRDLSLSVVDPPFASLPRDTLRDLLRSSVLVPLPACYDQRERAAGMAR
jgi:hypothetical protein